jgi:lysine 6-dehydrogenase
MVVYAVLGLGMMGRAICHDLLKYDRTSSKVLGFDIDTKKREDLTKEFKKNFGDRFKTLPLELNLNTDVKNHHLINNFRHHDVTVVFGAIDYKFNYFLSKLCIETGCSFLDLGGNPSVVQLQKELEYKAKKAAITVIPDLGLAPGMVNIFAANGMRKFDQLHECHLRVGGLPQNPKTMLKYQRTFAIRGLTNEYLENAVVIRNGIKQTIPSLTELEELEFQKPWGILEAFQTAGGISSLPELFENQIDELTYKTIRYPGHYKYFRFLKELGLLSSDSFTKKPVITPREIVEYYLEQYLPINEPDVVLARISITGLINGQHQKHTYELIDLMDQTGYSAMARTTAIPTSIIGQFIAHKKIITNGVVPGETVVPFNSFVDELKKRKIEFNVKMEVM